MWCCLKSTKKEKFALFKLKWLLYVENISPFSLFFLYASNNLVHIPLHLGTFHPNFQTTRTNKTFCWRYTKFTWKLLSISLMASFSTSKVLTSEMNLNILNWACLPCKHQYNTRNQKGKGNLLWDCFYPKVKKEVTRCFSCYPKMKAGCRRPGATRAQP